MTPVPPPPSDVTATLHGGPRNGMTLSLPWARYYIALPDWDSLLGEETRMHTYRLRPPWRGQATADYDYEPAEDLKEAA